MSEVSRKRQKGFKSDELSAISIFRRQIGTQEAAHQERLGRRRLARPSVASIWRRKLSTYTFVSILDRFGLFDGFLKLFERFVRDVLCSKFFPKSNMAVQNFENEHNSNTNLSICSDACSLQIVQTCKTDMFWKNANMRKHETYSFCMKFCILDMRPLQCTPVWPEPRYVSGMQNLMSNE